MVAFEQALEGLCGLPFRVFGSEGLHPIRGEGELGVELLFEPQRTVVIEDRNSLGGRDVVVAARIRDGRDEFQNRGLRGAVVPGGQRVRGACASGRERDQPSHERSGEESRGGSKILDSVALLV
jgi:hypothetical protein